MSAVGATNYTNNDSKGNAVSFFQKIATAIVPYYALNAQLESIKQKVAVCASHTLNDPELALVQEAFTTCNKPFAGKVIKNLKSLPLTDVKKAIFQALEHVDEATIRACLDRFLVSLKNEDLFKFLGVDEKGLNCVQEKNILLKDKALQSVVFAKGRALWKELYYETFYWFMGRIGGWYSESNSLRGMQAEEFKSATLACETS